MRNLREYIFEDRNRVGKLPFSFELFNNFMQDAIMGGSYDDSEYWIQMEDIIINKYNKKVWEIFKNFVESFLDYHYEGDKNPDSIQIFYDNLSNILTDRIDKTLGAGSNGIVIDLGNDKVVKIFYGNHIKQQDRIFLKWCYKNKSSVFPKIYKMGKSWVIMEKLDMYTPSTKKLMDILDNHEIDGKKIWTYVSKGNLDINKISKDELWAYNWGLVCKQDFSKINSDYCQWPGDLNIKNIGERKNGDIIFFDI